jgi:hypothetical protein
MNDDRMTPPHQCAPKPAPRVAVSDRARLPGHLGWFGRRDRACLEGNLSRDLQRRSVSHRSNLDVARSGRARLWSVFELDCSPDCQSLAARGVSIKGPRGMSAWMTVEMFLLVGLFVPVALHQLRESPGKEGT